MRPAILLFFQASKINCRIRLGAIALRLPDHFPETFHHAMLRIVLRVELPRQAREMCAYTRRLANGNLLLDGEVHHQVQERIGRAVLRQVVLILVAFRVFQRGVIFRVFGDELRGEVFQRREQFTGPAFAPGLE